MKVIENIEHGLLIVCFVRFCVEVIKRAFICVVATKFIEYVFVIILLFDETKTFSCSIFSRHVKKIAAPVVHSLANTQAEYKHCRMCKSNWNRGNQSLNSKG